MNNLKEFLNEEYYDKYKGKMFGKEVTKTERSTFVFDKDMNLVKEFRKVKPDENPQEVLDFVRDNLND